MEKKEKIFFIYATIVFMLLISYFFIPTSGVEYLKFDRSLGMGAVFNYDADRLKNKFYLFLFLLPFVTYIGLYFIKNFDLTRVSSAFSEILTLNFLILIINLLFLNVNKYHADSIYLLVGVVFQLSIFLVSLLYIKYYKEYVTENTYKWILLNAFITLIPISLLSIFYNSEMKGMYFYFVDLLFLYKVVLMIIMFISLCISFLHIASRMEEVKLERIKKTGRIYFLFPFFMVVALEIFNILNQRGIYVVHRRIALLVLYVIVLLVWIGLFNKKNYRVNNDSWERIAYLFIIISITSLSMMIPTTTIVETDLFEQANTGVSISQFILFGKIPLIESHGAHLLSDYIWGIFYAVLNGNMVDALFFPYHLMGRWIGAIVFYELLRKIIKEDEVLLIFLFAPFVFSSNAFYEITHICMISFFAYSVLRKKPCYKTYFVYWVLLFFSLIYKGDYGMAFGVSTIYTVHIFYILGDKSINIKKYWVTFFSTSFMILLIYGIICYIRNINMINRLLEFVRIMLLSNKAWSYNSIGDTQKIYYFLTYFFFPSIILFSLIYLGVYFYKKKEEIHHKELLYLIFSFGIAYIINLSRVLGRHSLVEQNVFNRNFMVPFFLALFIYFLFQDTKFFVTVFIFSMLTLIMLENNGLVPLTNYVNVAVEKFNFSEIENINFRDRGRLKRVIQTKKMEESYDYIIEELNHLLKENETFLDFTNQTLLFSLSQRYNPVYINQSPAFLTDEDLQDIFIEQVKDSDKEVCLVLMPSNGNLKFGNEIDGLKNSYKHYKVAEYIYNHFVPLEIIGDYAIWSRRELASHYMKIIKGAGVEDSSVFLEKLSSHFTEKLSVNNISFVKWNNLIQANATGRDPYFYGVENYMDFSFLPSDHSKKVGIVLEYESNVPGDVTLLYTNEKYSNFGEENSVVQQCGMEGVLNFEVELYKHSAIRLDIPDNSQFKIKNLYINQSRKYKDTEIDYFYGDKYILHQYYLGYIPYLWGNLDKRESYSNDDIIVFDVQKENRDVMYKFDSKEIDFENGTYMYLKLKSQEETRANVKFYDINQNEVSSYHFEVKQGEYVYMIRITTDFTLYSEKVNQFRIEIESPDTHLDELMFKAGIK